MKRNIFIFCMEVQVELFCLNCVDLNKKAKGNSQYFKQDLKLYLSCILCIFELNFFVQLVLCLGIRLFNLIESQLDKLIHDVITLHNHKLIQR